jgi:hypothetical protein
VRRLRSEGCPISPAATGVRNAGFQTCSEIGEADFQNINGGFATILSRFGTERSDIGQPALRTSPRPKTLRGKTNLMSQYYTKTLKKNF